MTPGPFKRLAALGQSPWLDFIERALLESGELERMIEEWGLRGMTSNPVIFEKAIAETDQYGAAIDRLARDGLTAPRIYESLAFDDVRRAADSFRRVYDASAGRDGFVSLEVSPHLARDAEGTVLEAKRLWTQLARPNVMIKVPGTSEGLVAIRRLLAAGINVNVTLLFSVARYREVVATYMQALEDALEAGRRIDRTASVASFFLSRIDTLIDGKLEPLARAEDARGRQARALLGEVAIASARSAYRVFETEFASQRYARLAQEGAQVQRPLWASTGTKNPDYSDVKYVEALIGPRTVSTMPLATLRAYEDHGRPEPRLDAPAEQTERTLRSLVDLGVDLEAATAQLLEEGIVKFVEPYDKLLGSIEAERAAALQRPA